MHAQPPPSHAVCTKSSSQFQLQQEGCDRFKQFSTTSSYRSLVVIFKIMSRKFEKGVRWILHPWNLQNSLLSQIQEDYDREGIILSPLKFCSNFPLTPSQLQGLNPIHVQPLSQFFFCFFLEIPYGEGSIIVLRVQKESQVASCHSVQL